MGKCCRYGHGAMVASDSLPPSTFSRFIILDASLSSENHRLEHNVAQAPL